MQTSIHLRCISRNEAEGYQLILIVPITGNIKYLDIRLDLFRPEFVLRFPLAAIMVSLLVCCCQLIDLLSFGSC